MPPMRTHLVVPLLALLPLASSVPVVGQVPDAPYRNLQVLPKDITRPELIEIMRGFSFALGARCEDCHVGPESGALDEIDFPADDRARKRKARAMLRMVQDINERQLAILPDRSADPPAVSCATCHRGQFRPLLLEDTLARVIAARGVAAAAAEYRTLHERHYGSGEFDFRAQPLINVAERLLPADTAGALELLQLAVEMHPRSPAPSRSLARLLLARGDREGALFAAVRALDLSPQDFFARRVLDQILAR